MSQRTSKIPVFLSALVLKPAVAEKESEVEPLEGDFFPNAGAFPKFGFFEFRRLSLTLKCQQPHDHQHDSR